jgi:hypothetical protein
VSAVPAAVVCAHGVALEHAPTNSTNINPNHALIANMIPTPDRDSPELLDVLHGSRYAPKKWLTQSVALR